MNKKTLGFLVIILILIGCFTFFYFKVIIPNREESNKTFSLSVSAEYNNQKVKTGVIINGIDYNLTESYELIKVKQNEIIKITNKNLINQNYYIKSIEVNMTEDKRIDLELTKPKEIIIKKDYEMNNVNLEIDTYLEDAFICLQWTNAYYFVLLNNYTESSKPSEYKSWDRCYNIGKIEGKKDYVISFDYYRIPQDYDFIEMVIFSEYFPEHNKIETIK